MRKTSLDHKPLSGEHSIVGSEVVSNQGELSVDSVPSGHTSSPKTSPRHLILGLIDVFCVNVLDVLKTCLGDVFGTGDCPLGNTNATITSSNGKHFPRYWPFVRGIHLSSVNSLHKGQWRRALMFSLINARINGWVNNREDGDLRRHRAYYDAIVMLRWLPNCKAALLLKQTTSWSRIWEIWLDGLLLSEYMAFILTILKGSLQLDSIKMAVDWMW